MADKAIAFSHNLFAGEVSLASKLVIIGRFKIWIF